MQRWAEPLPGGLPWLFLDKPDGISHIYDPNGGDVMEGTAVRAEQKVLEALAAGDVDELLGCSSPRLFIAIRGSDPIATRVPTTSLAQWFCARDALTDAGVQTQVVASLERGNTTVTWLRHSLSRGGQRYSYETVDRWTFRSGWAVAWFSRPIDQHEYACAWGVACPVQTHVACHVPGTVRLRQPARPDTTEIYGSGLRPDDDLDPAHGGQELI
jgi:ketosteroid isomerase-like protein